jgi:uncharacterized protein (DUF1330 family)
MAAYIIALVDIRDKAAFERYRVQVPTVIEKYGGKYLIRGGAREALEGAFPDRRIVVLEFDSAVAAKRFWDSPEYKPLRGLRERAAGSDVVLVEGV